MISVADCSDPDLETPVDGDLRLVPLFENSTATRLCDDVHLGGVELFRQGRWGAICTGNILGFEDEFTLDAQVVCRQLGFPFGTVMEPRAPEFIGGNYDEPEGTIWATKV